MSSSNDADVRAFVKDYYGQQLASSEDLKTNACCAAGAPPAWLAALLKKVHPDVLARFYGCGFPIPEALQGATAVDLGCGTGRDVFLLAQLVGAEGAVHGVDMTDAQLEVARATRDWHAEQHGLSAPNTHFHTGYIETLSELPLEAGSVDVIVSNCVVNLSPRKDLVLEGAYALLKEGGEFYLSDVVCDRRLPEDVARDPVLHAECLGGAMYERDFITLAKRCGFLDPRVISRAPITIQNSEIEAMVGAARFSSVTYRLFKLPELDAACEDHGQIATYLGTIPGATAAFWLDDHHCFEAHRPERVCGNTAAMLQQTRLREHFTVAGDRSRHFGAFDCSATAAAEQYAGRGHIGSGAAAPQPAAASSCCGPASGSSSSCC